MFNSSLLKAVNNIWPMLTIFTVIITTMRIAYIRSHSKEFIFYKEFLNLIFIIYLVLLFELVTNTDSSNGGINLIPFTEIMRHSLSSTQFIYNVLGNILVFLPFGYFVSAYINSKKFGQMFFITFIASLTIELVQLQIGRSFDIDDIILNVIGGILGFLLFVALAAIKKHLPGIFQKNFLYNILCIVIIVLIVIYFINALGYGF